MSKRKRHRNVMLPATRPLIDLHRIDEDERCRMIATVAGTVAGKGKVVAFMVDDEKDAAGEHKADRYVRKILVADPRLIEYDRTPGPVANVITVRIGLPEKDN